MNKIFEFIHSLMCKSIRSSYQQDNQSCKKMFIHCRHNRIFGLILTLIPNNYLGTKLIFYLRLYRQFNINLKYHQIKFLRKIY